MPTRHRPRRGSLAYSPRKRAARETPRIRAWPEGDGAPAILGSAGYKAGMTHVIMIDDRANSLTEGMEISVPVTIIETPPIKIIGLRAYKDTFYGMKTAAEAWSEGGNAENNVQKIEQLVEAQEASALRVIATTNPQLVSGIPKKQPEMMEISVGGKPDESFEYAKKLLGQDVSISDVFNPGELVDVTAVTKGKGTQGPVKRWGVMIQAGKAYRSGKGRHIGNLGPWHPARVRWTVPQMGQTGYHQRTEHNKRILKMGENGEEATPNGGFIKYGVVRNEYVMLQGSVPGPNKRLIRIRRAMRPHKAPSEAPQITHISTESTQG